MSANPQEELKKLLEEYKKLAGKPFTLFNENNVRDINQGINTLKNEITAIQDETFKLEGGFSGLRKTIHEVSNEFKGINSNQDKAKGLVKEINKEYAKVEKIAKDLQYDAAGFSKLSEKELETLSKKLQIQRTELGSKAESLKTELGLKKFGDEEIRIYNIINKAKKAGRVLDDKALTQIAKNKNLSLEQVKALSNMTNEQVAILSANKENFDEIQQLITQADIRLKKEKDVTKELGVFGGVLKGIGKIPIIGDLVDTEDALKAAREETEKTNSGLKGLKAGLGNLKGQVMQSLTNPANIALFAFTQMLEALQGADKATGDLAKSFNMTYDEASKTRNELIQIGISSGDVALNARALQETLTVVGNTLGSNAKLNEADLKTFTKLREQAGFANEELASMERTTLATGGNLEDNTASLMHAAKTTGLNNKVLLNEKDIMRDVAKASDAVKLSLAGNPAALGKAAAQAKALGMSLQQVNDIAGSLLNFEQSISSELEAELITGKDLNLEQARLYAINNDMEGLSREIAKNFGSAADFSKMNRLQQEAAAKAVGMNREELAKTLTDQEALKGLTGDQANKAKEALDAARARGMSEEEIAKQGMDNLMKQQSVQERMNNSVEKLKEVFMSIAQPIMQMISPIIDILIPAIGGIMTLLSPIIEGFRVMGVAIDYIGQAWNWFVDKLQPIMPVLKGIGIAILAILSPLIAAAAIAAFMALAAIPIVGPVLAVAAAAGAASFLYSMVSGKKIQDGQIAPDGGLTVSGKKGTYQLDKNDHVIAGTDLGGKVNPNSSTSTQQDNSALIAEMRAMRQEQAKSNSKPTVVENSVNGTKFGTAVAMNTYKIQ